MHLGYEETDARAGGGARNHVGREMSTREHTHTRNGRAGSRDGRIDKPSMAATRMPESKRSRIRHASGENNRRVLRIEGEVITVVLLEFRVLGILSCQFVNVRPRTVNAERTHNWLLSAKRRSPMPTGRLARLWRSDSSTEPF